MRFRNVDESDLKLYKYKILNKDKLNFIPGEHDISIEFTYSGYAKKITLKSKNEKLDLSKYIIDDVIKVYEKAPLNRYAFEDVIVKQSDFIYKFVEKLKEKYSDLRNIDIDEYIKLFNFETNRPLYASIDGIKYTFDLISTIKEFVTGKVKVSFRAEKIPFRIEELLQSYIEGQTRFPSSFRDIEIDYSYETYFDSTGYRTFEQIKEYFQEEIRQKLEDILLKEGWLNDIMVRNGIRDYYNLSVTNLSFDEYFSFDNYLFNMDIKFDGKVNKHFYSKKTTIPNRFNIKLVNHGISYSEKKSFFDFLEKKQQTYNYTVMADTNTAKVPLSETGFINDAADDFINIKDFINGRLLINGEMLTLNNYMKFPDQDISNNNNGYFFYFQDKDNVRKSMVLRVFVDYYNNDGNYKKDDVHYAFSTGKITFELWYMERGSSRVYGWQKDKREYKIINRTEYEWYSKFRSELDNKNSLESSWWFDPNNNVRHAGQYILDQNISWSSPEKWETYGGKWKHDGEDHFLYEFGLEDKRGNKSGRKYVLKLGGTGDISKLNKANFDFLDYMMKYAFTLLGGKVRLNFNLYRSDDYDKTNDKLLLPIGKGKRYHLAR